MTSSTGEISLVIDGPPPPYSREDPNAHLLQVYRLPEQATSSSSGLDDPTTYVADGFSPANVSLTGASQPAAASQSSFTEPSPRFDSAQAYFESRLPPAHRPAGEMPFFMTILPTSVPESFSFPQPEENWLQRDVTADDWITFLNYLFPHHLASENARLLADKSSNISSNTTEHSLSDLARDTAEQNQQSLQAYQDQVSATSAEDDTTRRQRLQAVITEWNSSFFIPRGIKINPYIVPLTVRSTSSLDTTTSPNPLNSTFAFHVRNSSSPAPFEQSAGRHDVWQDFNLIHEFGEQVPSRDRRVHPNACYLTAPFNLPPSNRERHHHGGRHHRHASDSGLHGWGGPGGFPFRGGMQRGRGFGWDGRHFAHQAPWMRPYEGFVGRRGGGFHGRGHRRDFGGSHSDLHRGDHHESWNPTENTHQADSNEEQHRLRHRRHNSETLNTVSSRQDPSSTDDRYTEAADLTNLKNALHKFYMATVNDWSSVHDNIEQLKSELHAEKSRKKQDLGREIRRSFTEWSQGWGSRGGSSSTAETSAQSTAAHSISPISTSSDAAQSSPAHDERYSMRDMAKAVKDAAKQANDAYKQQAKAMKDAEKQRRKGKEKAEKLSRLHGNGEAIKMRNLSKLSPDDVLPVGSASESGSSQSMQHNDFVVFPSWITPPASDTDEEPAEKSATDEHGVERGII